MLIYCKQCEASLNSPAWAAWDLITRSWLIDHWVTESIVATKNSYKLIKEFISIQSTSHHTGQMILQPARSIHYVLSKFLAQGWCCCMGRFNLMAWFNPIPSPVDQSNGPILQYSNRAIYWFNTIGSIQYSSVFTHQHPTMWLLPLVVYGYDHCIGHNNIE